MNKNQLKKLVRNEFLKLTGVTVSNKNIIINCSEGTFDRESISKQLNKNIQYSFECWKKMHANYGAFDDLKGVDLSFDAFKCSDMFDMLKHIELR